jgi:hypothetical protein
MIIPVHRPCKVVHLLTLVSVLVLARPAFPWGCEGHRVVALIALDQLNPHARRAATQLLDNRPADPALRRFCSSSSLPAFVDLSTWADDIRSQRKETSGWHFIDIPLSAKRSNTNDACTAASGCVTVAIRRQLDVLHSPTAGNQEQAEALMFLIHFVGDLHQPLHAADNADRGGNCVAVAMFDKKPETSGSSQNYRPNLHGVWDTDLVEAVAHGREPSVFADALRQEFARQIPRWKRRRADIDAWAWESHNLAIKTVYGKLPGKVPVEPPQPVESCADRDMGKRMYDLHEEINQRYLTAASPVIRSQLARAGTRLATLLNEVWP